MSGRSQHATHLKEESGPWLRLTLKRTLISHIIHEQDAHGTAVVSCCDSAKTFLASCVPNLQLYALAVELNGAYFEIDANGRDEARSERVLAKAQQAARLADARVADKEQFDLERERVGRVSTQERQSR